MSLPCLALLVASVVGHHGANQQATSWEDEDFFSHCPPSRCSQDGPEIRFPFRLNSSNTPSSCGSPCLKLACSGQDTILDNKYLGMPYKVTAIDYRRTTLAIIPLQDDNSLSSLCSLPKSLDHHSYSYAYEDYCNIYNTRSAVVVSCSTEFTPASISRPFTANLIAGPISCLSNATHFSYLVESSVPMYLIPSDCEAVSIDIPIPSSQNFSKQVETFFGNTEATLHWKEYYNCYLCEQKGRRCAYSSQRNQTFCMHHGSHVKVIAATSSTAAVLVLLSMVATALYLSLKTRYDEEINLKVEMFLKTYGASKPTRYSFSEVKKIARRFKNKLGQGGFGSVYKVEPKKQAINDKGSEHANREVTESTGSTKAIFLG
ncbi:hypothetical protein GUJ93_ZPchr0001g30629 [Zizania palustris]|uniref:RING-type E3 ubiquitin transferase n=1 Tax=Zizania palustris TaxID=103762 RepID=A0A8J5SED5_ZIZPA|nr:hypothetical protein GUJ93_ZPchr0001g30629 [Zizania palustris]KAG8053740.1 hypothetical protein GUJ93_ZPchr0001g30629 [Zizania palustris]